MDKSYNLTVDWLNFADKNKYCYVPLKLETNMPEVNNPNYIGTGIAFPLRVNVQGELKTDSGDRNLEESIATILNTKLGERVYRPNFGSRLSDLVFAPMNPQTILLARVYVEEALNRWEPRIVVTGVYAEPDPIKGRLDLKILFRLKDGHDNRSMVYPFYLLPPNSQ